MSDRKDREDDQNRERDEQKTDDHEQAIRQVGILKLQLEKAHEQIEDLTSKLHQVASAPGHSAGDAAKAAFNRHKTKLERDHYPDPRQDRDHYPDNLKKRLNKSIRKLGKETMADLLDAIAWVEYQIKKPGKAYQWMEEYHPVQQALMEYIQRHTMDPDKAEELCELMDWGNYETVGKSGKIKGEFVEYPWVLFRPDWKLMEKILGVPVSTLRDHVQKLFKEGRIKKLGFDAEPKQGGQKIYAVGYRTAYKREFFFRRG